MKERREYSRIDKSFLKIINDLQIINDIILKQGEL